MLHEDGPNAKHLEVKTKNIQCQSLSQLFKNCLNFQVLRHTDFYNQLTKLLNIRK